MINYKLMNNMYVNYILNVIILFVIITKVLLYKNGGIDNE